ncbi:uncharacterized protein LTR77_011140 [Saxophila tyrrhenica]|uniref:Major facilitator superfamily (MFS) profile domain-containing protein n=1 Tax=Saxophila tyrrhenica TaxID=1690608 RepID=A0AAV9NW53_9PEZI|nr:hypothetical protein LTR77_011140 [Saxophila tyrrhenica]
MEKTNDSAAAAMEPSRTHDDNDRKVEHTNNNKVEAAEAQVATAKEHGLTLTQALKAYPKAIGWSILLSSAVVMEGYDTILIGSYFGFPSFNNTFGNQVVNGEPSITAPWQSAVGNGAYIGEILGLQLTGYFVEWYGNKKVMAGATVLMIAFIFISFFGETLPLQLVGQILCGIVIGQFIASGVLVGVQNRTDEWGWKIPFAIQWVWPLPIIAVCLLCPESPTWLVSHDRTEDAVKAVGRLQSPNTGVDLPTPHETVAMLSQTDAIERRLTSGAGYLECFKGTNLRRTEVAVGTWVTQQMCGPVLQTYAIVFFQQAGMTSEESFDMGLGLYAIAFVGTLLSWPMIKQFGRRPIFLTGLSCAFVTLMIVGFLSLGDTSNNTSLQWAIGAMLLVYTFIYDSTIGPLTYVIVPEAPSSRLRHKTTVLARNAYNITCIWTGVITPYMLNETAWNWSAKSGFFWAGSTAICLTWAFFRLPESKNATFAELDLLYERGVSARKFNKEREAIIAEDMDYH